MLIKVRLTHSEQKINVTQKELQHLLENFNSNNMEQITRFVVTLVYKFSPESLQFVVLTTWNSFFQPKRYDFLQLLGPLFLGSYASVEWLDDEKVRFLVEKLVKKIENYSPKKHKKLNNLLYCVYCIVQCRNSKVNGIIVNYHCEIYNALKSKTKNELKDLEPANFELVFKILKDLILGDATLQEKFIKQFIEDLANLTQKKVVVFAEQFLVPFLNASLEVPVCLHPYYYNQQRSSS